MLQVTFHEVTGYLPRGYRLPPTRLQVTLRVYRLQVTWLPGAYIRGLTVSKLVEPCQKGFLQNKSGADHTVDINTWFFDGVAKNESRLLFFLDTAKAFDSIDHFWIFSVLERAGFPHWFRFFVRGSLDKVAGPLLWY